MTSDTPYPLGRRVWHDPASRGFAHPPKKLTLTHSLTWPRRAPIFDQGQTSSCFPPGTHVRMADGSERPIESVRLGELVVTAEGNTGRVVRTLLRDEDGGLLRLSLWGHSHLRLTREHPVLTERGYVSAAEVRIGDRVALTKYQAGTRTHIATEEHVTQATHRVVRGTRWQGLPDRRSLQAGAHKLPEKIELTERFGRLIGLFLAEGNCGSASVQWSLHINERDTLGAEIVSIMRDLGADAHTRDIPTHHGHKVVIHGTAWTRLLSSLCGNGSGLKRLHPDLTAGPPEFLAAVFSGWRDGDGHQRPHRAEHTGVTISRDLALGMYDIAQGLGLRPVIRHVPPVQNRHAATRQWRWEVATASGADSRYSTQDEVHVWRKVRSTHLEDYVGPVYDLTVEGDHSYVAEGVAVHNCTGNAMAGWLGTDPHGTTKADETLAVALYSEATGLDNFPGHFPPEDTGSSGLAVCKAARARGLITSYRHAFSLTAALDALTHGPIIVGVPWYESMFTPETSGYLTIAGDVVGGHEFLIRGIDPNKKHVLADNSWGLDWGRRGRFWLHWDDLERLLGDQGDATVPIR